MVDKGFQSAYNNSTAPGSQPAWNQSIKVAKLSTPPDGPIQPQSAPGQVTRIQPEPPKVKADRPNASRRIVTGRVSWSILIVCLLIIGAFFLVPPWGVLNKTRLIGYAICHQIPERSFHISGQQLPLCARCSGTFLGALIGFVLLTLWKRRRSAGMPPVAITVLLICFIGAMGVDGLNSYLTLFPGMPHLYEPQNWLRLTTGILNGIALSNIVYPVLNYSLWRDAVDVSALRNFKELGVMLITGGIVIVLVLLELPPFLYPLAVLSTLGVLIMLGTLNTMIALTVTGHEGRAVYWQQAVLPLVIGLAFAFVEIGAIDMLRAMLTRAMGLPF